MHTRLLYTVYIFLSCFWNVSSQYIQINDTYTAQQIVNTLIDNSCRQVSNISLSGSTTKKSYGYFSNSSINFPFSSGIILSTGYATSAINPNTTLLSDDNPNWQMGDQDLEKALGINKTINLTILEFDFISYTEKISFDYIFSSEQYLTNIINQNQCNFTDGFAFLIKEASGTAPYINIALVPGTSTPVKVNTVRGKGVCPPC